MTSNVLKFNRVAVLKSATIFEANLHPLINVQPLHHLLTSFCNSHLIWRVQTFLPSVTRHQRMSQDLIFRSVCCLMSTEMSFNSFSLNDLWSLLLKHFFQSCCLKYEILSNLLANLIGNGFYKEARSEYNSVWAKKRLTYFTCDIFEQIVKSCIALCDYMNCVDELNYSYQPSQQNEMILEQVLNSWTTLLKRKSGPLDFIIPRILDIYLHKNEIDDALECLIAYKDLNNDNLNSYIYVFKFIVAYDQKNPENQKIIEDCFYKIVDLSPDSPLILEMLNYCQLGSRFTCKTLMEFVDYLPNKDNLTAWSQLSSHLSRLDAGEMKTIKNLYKSTYSNYWPEYHWNSLKSNESSPELSEWKEKVNHILEAKSKSAKQEISPVKSSRLKKPKLEA